MAQGSSETSNQTNRGREAHDPTIMDLGSLETSDQTERARQAPDSRYAAEIEELRKKVVTLLQCVSIQEEAGNYWRDLGAVLEIPESEIRNIETDHQRARDRGFAVLQSWRDRKGCDATVGCLFDAFKDIGKKWSAEKLLEVCRAKR
ncbi:uncharacterized protein LOC111346044 [Stylophora pistillata]|uniref:uncharacterized protein LOC111346044 n=1 Tax=Stylophora pistillata TaxID=50429 RepID=UPI000C04F8B9|nr:uncharacterized protein LOC111346044 [Stylophora pistillata]